MMIKRKDTTLTVPPLKEQIPCVLRQSIGWEDNKNRAVRAVQMLIVKQVQPPPHRKDRKKSSGPKDLYQR